MRWRLASKPSPAVIHDAILNRTPTPAGRVNPDLPPELERVINKALEKNRDLRYQHASEIRSDLKRLKRGTDSGRSVASAPVADAPPSPWRPNRAVLGIAAVALLALLMAAGWFYRSRMSRSETIDSLAVLPFVNASGDPNTEYLSDGITESLINGLSQLPHLKVMSRDSAFMYKDKQTDARTVGSALGVRAVLEGRVVQRGDTLSISTELVDARDDSHIWGQQYDRKVADMIALRDDIAKEMTTALRMRLTGDDEKRMTKSYTANPEAYQDYLKGRYWLSKRSEEGYNKGIEYFEKAIGKDPTYALAYSGLADSYSGLGGADILAPKEVFPNAKEAALKALEIDDTLAEAHYSLARVKLFYDWDWSGAEREFQRAIELNPSYPNSYNTYGYLLWDTGRLQESIAEEKRALALDPLSVPTNRDLGYAYYMARQYDQAIDQERKTLELDPTFAQARAVLGRAYLQKSQYKEGIAELERALAASPAANPNTLSDLGYAYAVAGRRADAQKAVDRLTEISKTKYADAAFIARIYAALGNKDKAFECLEKGYGEHATTVTYIKVDPRFDPLRSDPRFADLLRRMNLQP